jgi:hypothetical protein
VARGLETEWERRLRGVTAAETELRQREHVQSPVLVPDQIARLRALGADIQQAWHAPSTTDRDRKELLRTLLEEVAIAIAVHRPEQRAHLTMRWRGGTITSIELRLPRLAPSGLRTNEDTIDLIRRPAAHYPDEVIAGILALRGVDDRLSRRGGWSVNRASPAQSVSAAPGIAGRRAADGTSG